MRSKKCRREKMNEEKIVAELADAERMTIAAKKESTREKYF